MREHIVIVDQEKCVGCGICKRDCVQENIIIKNKKALIKTQNCIKCGHCLAVCPKGAVSLSGFLEPPIEIKEQVTLDPARLLRAIRSRRSIRRFQMKPVEDGIIAQIIEAGRFTPSAKNAQDVSYVILKDSIERYEKEAVRLFRKLMPLAQLAYPGAKGMTIDEHFFFKKAPAAIVILSKDKVSASLAASNMALMAEAEGLGVLYSGFFTMAANVSRSLRYAFGIKGKYRAVTTLVLGYPDVKYYRTVQKEKPVVRRM